MIGQSSVRRNCAAFRSIARQPDDGADFRCWHETDMPMQSSMSVAEGMNGPDPDAARLPKL
jgi:hypothetical protein